MRDPYLIDPKCLAEQPQVLEGIFHPRDLERLEDSLANGDGELRYRIAAHLDPQRRKVVSCIIEGFVFLTCQTSLEAFRHDVALHDRLILVEHESQLPAVDLESEMEDHLVADEPLDIRDLVEDAVLLSLPMFPRKPGLEAAGGVGAGPESGGAEAPREHEASPFAALAALKKQPR
jgi:uncharacterized protein